MSHDRKIAVIGLDCVELPMAAACAGSPVNGFDIDAERVRELQAGRGRTREVDASDLKLATLDLTSDKAALEGPSTPYRPRSMRPIGPIWVPCSRPRAVPVIQEIAVGEK